jgi:hypothetical protein
MNCVDPQVSQVESVGSGSEMEPPVKRRRGRPPMESNMSSFSPKVASVTGAGGTEEVFIVSIASSVSKFIRFVISSFFFWWTIVILSSLKKLTADMY